MGNFFGVRRRAPVVTAQDRAILQLKQQRDKIKIYQKKTEADLVKNKDLAIQLYNNGLKERALVALRRKKCMEDILSRTDKQLATLEQLVHDIEFTQIEVSVVEGLKVGTQALKQLTDLMNIDDIQQMMDDSAEAAEKQKEITQILEQSAVRYEEDDLISELDSYKKQEDQELKPEYEESTVSDNTHKIPTTITEIETTNIDAQKEETTTVQEKLDDLPEVPEVIQENYPKEPEKRPSPKKEKQRELEPAQ